MADFLLELFSEEIPARMQPAAAAQLKTSFERLLEDAGLSATRVEAHATPRRLTLLAWGLPAASAATREERRGPRADAPEGAVAGFLKSTGLTREQLEARDDPKGRFLYAVIAREGRPAAELLAERLPAMIAGFQWPKSMRWGAASASTASPRWVRPLRRIVALLDGDVVPFEALGVASGRETFGHRFMHAGPVRVETPASYVAQLRAAKVIVDAAERAAIIRDGAARLAADGGLAVVADAGLEAENAGLTEWPVPLLGRFDPAFLTVPREVIQLTMRTNQKYFALTNPPRSGEGDHAKHGGGVAARATDPQAAPGGHPSVSPDGLPPPRSGEDLAPAFICVANIVAADGGARIIAGNERVLSARLSDARFFWERDLGVPLEGLAPKLKDIVFHAKLGTVADKVERVARLARWLIESGAVPVTPAKAGAHARTDPQGPLAPGGQPSAEAPASAGATANDEVARLADLAERAARLAKCDLVTGTVGEFPEVQGIAGGYLTRVQLERQGVPKAEADAIADAVRDHYKPVGQGDEVPTAPVTVAVALADKLDTIVAFHLVGLPPTGSSDPFALRRAALGVIGLILTTATRLSLAETYEQLDTVIIGQITYRLLRPRADQEAMTLAQAGVDPRKLLNETHMRRVLEHPEIRAVIDGAAKAKEQTLNFFADRLKVQQRDAGTRHDVIDAVFALGDDDLVRLLARVQAVQGFIGSADGANLLAGYRRAANILKKEGYQAEAEPSGLQGGADGDRAAGGASRLGPGFRRDDVEAERALRDALTEADPAVAAALAAEDFDAAMRALATLRPAVDAFFDQVKVNADDPDVRLRRLALLAAVRDAMHRMADFSRIEG